MNKLLPFIALVSVFSTVSVAHSGDLIPSVGAAHLDEDGAALAGLEYRFDSVFYDAFRPTIGALVDTDGAVYGYAGAHWEFELDERWFLSPNVAVGLYENGDGVDLGGAIEFRSGLELAYQLDDMRIGLAFHHISNAGIYDDNPGSETLTLNVQIPVDF